MVNDGRYDHKTEWAGKRIVDFDPETGIPEPETTAYRIRMDYEDPAELTIRDKFAELMEDPGSGEITGLVIGAWDQEMWEGGGAINETIAMLAGAADRLPHLTALFIGDIVSEESEISWIGQGDNSPLFAAFPKLEAFGVRGGQGLTLGFPRHPNLKRLVIETGGMRVNILQEILGADLPALEHLELWLGTTGYGWDGTIEAVRPLLNSTKWPNLTHLGLRDSEIADEIAVALAESSLLPQLKTLDLSLGTLGDSGAEALVANPTIAKLQKLDIHYHYVSTENVTKLQALGIEVNASEPQDESKYGRYVAVGE